MNFPQQTCASENELVADITWYHLPSVSLELIVTESLVGVPYLNLDISCSALLIWKRCY